MATVFEISGPLALYRKPYTTTSTVSFPIPPPSAVAGLIACILGISNGSERDSCSAVFWNTMRDTRIAIQRLNSTAWFSTTVNFCNLKDPQKSPHIRVKHQFVKNPHYRIFVQGGVEERLRVMLAAGQFFYTPNLGTAYALADVSYQGSFDFMEQSIQTGIEVQVASAIPIGDGNESSIDFLKSGGVLKDTFPFRLSEKRSLEKTIPLLYPSSPSRRVVLSVWEGLDVTRYRDTCIAWLPSW